LPKSGASTIYPDMDKVDLHEVSTVSQGSALNIATAYGLDEQEVRVRVLVGSEFSLLHIVQTGSGAHPASYPMGTWALSLGGKAAGA
jgi:hypothetical protein